MTNRGSKREKEIKDDLLKRYEQVRGIVEEIFGTLVAKAAAKLTEDQAYRVLGVEPEDSTEMITAVWKAKAKVLHPDNKATGDEEGFKRIKDAFDTIMEDRKKEG